MWKTLDSVEKETILFWVKNSNNDIIRKNYFKYDALSVPEDKEVLFVETLRYVKKLLSLYKISNELAYNNWLVLLLDAVYKDVFFGECSASLKSDFRKLLKILEASFKRVSPSVVVKIGSSSRCRP